MKPSSAMQPLPLLPITRFSFQLGILLATVAGIQLYVLSTRTADFFAWTIGVPLTAAFLGAFFWANTPGFGIALRVGEWPKVRILIVATLALTVLMAITTLRHLDILHLDEGGFLARLAAWSWLVVYVGLPWLLLASFVRQERVGLDPGVRGCLMVGPPRRRLAAGSDRHPRLTGPVRTATGGRPPVSRGPGRWSPDIGWRQETRRGVSDRGRREKLSR
jgi:predicted outer membrane lipoprotein